MTNNKNIMEKIMIKKIPRFVSLVKHLILKRRT